jgi:hypothetical protein
MSVATEGRAVAREKGHGGERVGAGRPRTLRDDISVKIDRTVAAKAMYLARLKGMTLAEYLTEKVRPDIEREFARSSQAPTN